MGNTTYTMIPNPDPSRLKYAVHDGTEIVAEYATYDQAYDFIQEQKKDITVNHPAHYGGKDNPYEAIKVIEAWGLGFCLGNCLKYLSRAGKKSDAVAEDLLKARWYLDREIRKISGLDMSPYNHIHDENCKCGMEIK